VRLERSRALVYRTASHERSPPSDEVPRSSGIPLRMGEDAEPILGGPGAMRGVPRSGLWSEVQFRRAEPAASGRKVASVAEGNPPRARVPGSGGD
jgi:hypothetical protein